MGIDLLVEAGPICNGASEGPPVDQVKCFIWCVEPIGFSIINNELAIRWDPARLDWAEVGTNDYRTWKLISKIDGPNARACTDIKHTLRNSGEGRSKELAI